MTFREIPSCPGYLVNERGEVLGKRGRILKQTGNRKVGAPGISYLAVGISINNRARRRYVHLLVLEAFVGPRPCGLQTRHLNGNSHDNRLVNLTYGTSAENAADKVRHGTVSRKLDVCSRGHKMLDGNIIHGKKPSGKPRRQCRRCHNATQARYRARKAARR